jgi:hypothetical protein
MLLKKRGPMLLKIGMRAHLYRLPGGERLACDLFDETTGTLVEAKGDVRRESLRMAVGQLIDYRRLEGTKVHPAVLLPRRPSDDLKSFLRSAGVALVYRGAEGWISEPPR